MNVADANLLQPKTKRQRAILALIAARPVRSQEELAAMLEQQGYEVTQAKARAAALMCPRSWTGTWTERSRSIR